MGRGGRQEIILRRLIKKYGAAAVEDAYAVALDIGVAEHRFVRRYLERRPHPQMFLRQIDPLISRAHRVSRFHQSQNQGATRMNLIELNRSLRQLRLGGIAAVLKLNVALQRQSIDQTKPQSVPPSYDES